MTDMPLVGWKMTKLPDGALYTRGDWSVTDGGLGNKRPFTVAHKYSMLIGWGGRVRTFGTATAAMKEVEALIAEDDPELLGMQLYP